MTDTARQQLTDINLAAVLDFGWSQEELTDRVRDVFEDGFTDLLDEVADELSDEQMAKLAEVLSREDISTADIQNAFALAVPNYSDRVDQMILDQKAALIKGYVELLRVYYVEDPLMLSMLDDVSRMIEAEEWAAAAETLVDLQKEE